ncbi:MAG: histidine kinase, partial [Ignavibacteriae bacterium]|nr:histidine kinase [Ignavibacteriota bacterium]
MRIFLRISMFLVFLILFYFIFAPQNPHVKIIVTSNSLAKTENIYIAGNNKQLGSWQPDIIQLNKTDNNKWERTFTFETNSSLEFKFTKGSWASEALDENGNIPGNNNLIVTKDTTLNFNISLWNDGTARITFKGQITGTVNYIKQMTYDELLPRDIIVWLPPGYEQNPQKYYPVLYMNDGQNLFDPETSFTKVDWQIDEAADSLIRQNKIEPIIIVGINNTQDRNMEYAFTPKGTKYMEFIIKKLKPFIDSSYRTLTDRKNTAIGGSSSGGLISLMLAWNYPNYFSKAACFSPAFKYENFDYADSLEKYSDDNKDLQIYIYNGGIGLEEILQPGVDKIINFMEQKNFKLNDNLFVDIDKSA